VIRLNLYNFGKSSGIIYSTHRKQ